MPHRALPAHLPRLKGAAPTAQNCRADMLGELTGRPLVCLTLALVCGVAAAAGPPAAVWALAALAVLGLAWVALRRRSRLRYAFLLVLAALAGALLFRSQQQPGFGDVANLPPGGQTLVGTVANAPRYADGAWQLVFRAEEHVAARGPEPLTGRCYVRVYTDAPIRRGERWQLTGRLRPLSDARNPGGRSELHRLAGLGVRSLLTVGGPELAERLGPGDLGAVAGHAFAAQQRALSLLARFVAGPYRQLSAQVAASVIFGVHATPPPTEVADAFRRAGTIHLLVVSGAMVSSVFGLVFLPGLLGATWRAARLQRQSGWPTSGRGRITHRPGVWVAVVAVLLTTYYAVLTEGGQAVARAAIMGALVGVALILRRTPLVAREHGLNIDRYTLLAAAALAILIARPQALFLPGLQLSFAAVWALIYFLPKAEPLLRGMPRWIGQILVGTLAAQLATFPILMWHYGNAPLAGFAANLLAVPLAGVVLTGGILTCLLGVALPWLAPLPGWITGWATRGMTWVSALLAQSPWASPELPRPSPLLVIAWYLCLLIAGWRLARRSKPAPAPPLA